MNTFHLCGGSNPQPQLSHGENIRQTQMEGHFTKYLANTPQDCQSHGKKERLRKCHRPKEINNKTRRLNATWYPGWDPGKVRKWKTCEIQRKA